MHRSPDALFHNPTGLPYVLINPPADTILHAEDHLYVLSLREPVTQPEEAAAPGGEQEE